MCKRVIRLKVEKFRMLARKNLLLNDTEIGAAIGVNPTQIWRATLPTDDHRHNSPGTVFIAGALDTFDVPFEELFFLEKELRERNEK